VKKKEEADKAVERKETELITCLKELVRIPTFVPPGENYEQIVDFLIPLFEELEFKCERIEMPEKVYESRQKRECLKGKRMNLLASKNFNAEESVVVYTHLDVVPAGEGWTRDPFDAEVKEGKIYGRGVADSKGAVASLVTALKIMNEEELSPKYNIRVALTTDEEVGPYSGLCFFADEGLLRGDYCLCMDGDSDGIIVTTNGVINWEIKVKGKSCHSSTPFLGVNAIEKAMVVMGELEMLKDEVGKRESKASCSPYIGEITGYTHIKPVFNVTMIEGGVKENIIPASCTLRGDRRYIPEEDAKEVIQEFEDVVENIKRKYGIELEWRCKQGYPPMMNG
jgi:succinyl-diaminopimelate desuccinylase